MTDHRRAISRVLLLLGVACVFAGASGAFRYSTAGMVATAAAIAALLYAGATWFAGGGREDGVLIYTHDLRVACGAYAGRMLIELFPDRMRREVEKGCREALAVGQSFAFRCETGPAARQFEAAPIRSSDGVVVYGILLSGAMLPAAAAGRLTPVA